METKKKTPVLIKKVEQGVAKSLHIDASTTEIRQSAYEKEHHIEKVSLVMTIVSDGQENAITKILFDNGASDAFTTHGWGTAPSEIYDFMGVSNRKRIIFSLIRDNDWGNIKPALETRFGVSQSAKGVAILSELSTLNGVAVYKFITNNRHVVVTGSKRRREKMEEAIRKADEAKAAEVIKAVKKNPNYELVICIVNEGYTDLVMAAAKKEGARGGTILRARGTGNSDMEKFFGLVINPEKEMVLIVLDKSIRDKVMQRIYEEAGIHSKGQGICFSLPVHDVLGVSSPEEENMPQED